MLLEFNSESCDKLDGCPFSNKETKKQKNKNKESLTAARKHLTKGDI